MFDYNYMEHRALEALRPLDSREAELLRFLAEASNQRARRSPRRRLAEVIVALGLRLDPEVTSGRPRQIVLEGAHVHD